MNAWMIGGIALAAAVGMVLPLQALINARLAESTSGPLFASCVSFLVGAVALCLALLLLRTPLPAPRTMLVQPGWVWMGGLIGALFVLCSTILVPRLGTAALICLVVFGQMLGSLLLDHFGVLTEPRPADLGRLLGAGMVGAGALLVVRPWQAG